MRLIGMLDSPYVRRVAVSMRFMGISFTHESLSVFRDFDAFAAINPVVKAPTLVADDGTTLMDSSLILDYLERLVQPEHRLMPLDMAGYLHAQRMIGLALAACEKTVQIVYEHSLRPEEKRHQPWIDRVRLQLLAAYRVLEAEIDTKQQWLFGPFPCQADISIAVAWRFTQGVVAELVAAGDYPALSDFSKRAEALPEFLSAPFD